MTHRTDSRLSYYELRKRRTVLTGRDGHLLNVRANGAGELAVAQTETLLAIKQVDTAAASPLVATRVTGEAALAYDRGSSSTLLTSSTATGTGTATLQSRWYVNYQPGKRQVAELTYAPVGAPQGYADVGLFDDQDGFFFRLGPDGYAAWVHRGYGVGETVVPRAAWSVDQLDGAGFSKDSIDFTKAQRPFIRYAWLGVGDCEVGFILDDAPLVCHRFAFENALERPYMRQPNLPLRWQVHGQATTIRAICAQVGSEGGQSPLGLPFAVEQLTPVEVSLGELREVCSVRLAPESRGTVFADRASVITVSNQSNGIARLLWNPAFAVDTGWGPSASYHVDQNTSGRVVTDPGLVLGSDAFATATRTVDQSFDPILPLTKDYDGTPDVLTLAVYNPTGVIADIVGSLRFRDVP